MTGFGAYERVASRDATGTVLGFSVNEETGEMVYAVAVDGGLVTMFDEGELTSLGAFVPESEIYDGTSIRVSPKGEVLPCLTRRDPRGEIAVVVG